MDIQEQERNIYLTRQRNFFAGISGLAVLSAFLAVGKLALVEEKIIMVPGIAREMIIEGSKVSQSYLEESAVLYASCLLDLTADTISAKRDMILKHASPRSKKNIEALQQYFAVKEEEHKKFGLMTFFAVKTLLVNTKTLEVIIEGRLTSTFGKKGIEEENVRYLMSFDFVGGFLKIKEFSRLLPKEQEDTK
jgi:type IV conjugative transfer system protein TraE